MQKKYYSKSTSSKETKKNGSAASSVARNAKSSYDDKPDDIGEIPWLIAKGATEGWSNEKFQTEFKRAQSNINVPRTRQQTDPARDNLSSWLSPDKYSELETKARNTYIPAQFGQRMLDNERMREYAERYQNTYIPATLAQDAIHRSGTGNDFNALTDNALRSEFLRKLDTKSMQDELDALNNDLDSNKQQYNRTKAQYASYGNNTSDNGARAAKRYIDDYEAKQKRAAELERDIYDADNLQTLSKYSKYSENDDFSEYARRGAEIENPTWFQSEKAGLIPNLFNGGGSKINNPVTFYLENQHKGGEEAYEFMSDDELDTYNYVLAKYGSDEAEKYLSALRPQLNARSTGKLTADAAALANDYPVLSSAGSVLMTPLRTLGYIDASIKDASGQRIDPNSRNWLYGNMQNAARETVSENIASGATGNVGAFLYNTGMSVADNAAMVLMTGGGSIGQTVNLGIMGLGAASSSTQEALSRGATQDQALQVGALAGIAEALFEKVSLDNFIKMTSPGMRGAFLKNVLKQGGIEASEEICTEIANIISDELVMGGMSKYNTAVSEYIARGLTREEAERMAMADQAKEIGLSGLGGFLSGGAFGSFGQAIGNVRASTLYKDGSYDSDALINAALSMQDGSASKQLALEMQSGKVKRSNANLGHLLANYLNEGGDITSIIPSEQNTAEAQSAEEILRNGARAVAERETARMNENAGGNVVQQNTAQIQPVTLDNANSVSNTNDTRKTADTRVATSDMATQRTIEPRSASEAASSLRSAIERSTDSVSGLDVYSDEDGSVTVSRNGSVLAEMNAREASAMASSYDSETNAIDYIGGFHAAYQLASEGMTINQITDTSILASDLTRAQLQAAYDSGRNASIESKRAAALDPKASGFKAGVNRIDQSTKLSRKQRSQIRILDAIGKKYGVEIIVDDGVHYSDNGTMMSRSDANGFYNPSTGRIHINLNAVGEAYLAVGMHELVHHVKNFNESGYNTLESVVLGALEERGENVDALVKYQMEHFGYSESQAREEVVANSIPAILNDEAYVRKLVETDRTLAERIRDFLSDFVEFINETLRALEGEASWKQMRSLREDMDMLSTIAELFDVALLDAQSQHSKTPTHGERFSMKDPDMIDTREISPINDVTDRAKYEYLVKQFEDEGYVGRPVVVVENGNDGYIALTGSHRILAASEANIDVPCVVIPYSDEIIPLIQAYSDEDRVREATALYEAGEIDEDAYNLIVREEELNFENYNVPYTDQLRFSLKDASTVDVAAVERENSKLMKSLALAEDQVKLTRGHRVKEGYIGVLADKALRDYSSSYDSATLKDNLIKIFKFLAKAQKPNMSEVNSLGVGLMKAVLEKSNEFDAYGYNAYSDVRSYLRSTSITLSEDQRAEAAVLSDTYGKYRSSLFGSVKLTNDGMQLDTAWQKLSSMNSALFPPETNASDMPRVLAVAAEAIKRGNFYTNPYGYDLDAFAADAWSNILESYFKSQTFADVKQSEIDALNQKMRDERNAARKDAKAAEREIMRNAEQYAKDIAKRDKREAALRDQILLERVKRKNRPDGKELTPMQIASLDVSNLSSTPKLTPIDASSERGGKSKFAESVDKSQNVSDEVRNLIQNEDDIKYYAKIANNETLNEANYRLNSLGEAETLRWYDARPENATALDVAEGFILLKRYQDAGDYESAVTVITKLRQMGSRAGQTVQAYSILGRLTPEAMSVYAQKELDTLRDEMVKRFGSEWVDKRAEMFQLTPEEAEKIKNTITEASKLPEGRDKNVLIASIASDIEAKLPTNSGKVIKALARNFMLLNSRTMIRNVAGNAIIMPAYVVQDFIGAGIDKALSKKTGIRTTGFSLPSKEGLKAAAKGLYESYDDFRRDINTKQIENDRFEIGNGHAFKKYSAEQQKAASTLKRQGMRLSNALNMMDRITGFLLDAGDRPFFEYHFTNSINAQIRLNNATEPTAEMIEIATSEALMRTWQDDNAMTRAASKLRNMLNPKEGKSEFGFGTLVVPFTKTPANLVKALVDYSPAGLVNALARKARAYSYAVSKGTVTATMQKDFVTSLSKGITGTLIMLLSAVLANAGLITGGDDEEDKDLSAFKKNILGIAPYSVVIDGHSYTYDWAQPIGGLMAISADLVNNIKSGKSAVKGLNLDGETQEERSDFMKALGAGGNAILNALSAGGNVMFEQSFMSGIKNLFSENGVVDGIVNSLMSSTTQFIPTALGQIAQIADPYARASYESNNVLGTTGNKLKAKIPGMRNDLAPVVDVMGNDVLSNGGNNSAFNVFLNPSNTYSERTTEAALEIYRVYQETGVLSVVPRVAPYSLEYGETYKFTAHERAQYQRVAGQTNTEIVNQLLSSKSYAALSDDQRAAVLTDATQYANAIAKEDFLSSKGVTYDFGSLSWVVKARDAENVGLSAGDYMIARSASRGIEGIKDADGNTIKNSKGLQIMSAVYAIRGFDTLPEKQRLYLFESLGVGKDVRHWNKALVEQELAKMRR